MILRVSAPHHVCNFRSTHTTSASREAFPAPNYQPASSWQSCQTFKAVNAAIHFQHHPLAAHRRHQQQPRIPVAAAASGQVHAAAVDVPAESVSATDQGQAVVDSLVEMVAEAARAAAPVESDIGSKVYNRADTLDSLESHVVEEVSSSGQPAWEEKVRELFGLWGSVTPRLRLKALQAMGALQCSLTDVQKEQLRSSYPEDLLPNLTPRELTRVLRSFAELDVTVALSWVSLVYQQLEPSLMDCLASDLCDLVCGAAQMRKKQGHPMAPAFLEGLVEELGYQLHEFPADFNSDSIVDLVTGLAELQADVHKSKDWVPALMKTARLKVKDVGTGALVNQGLARLNIDQVITPRDARCTYEEVRWLPRHERDVREMAKKWKPSQWTGYDSSKFAKKGD